MPLKIEIYSDVVCPWCFLGKHRLEKALQSMKAPPDVEVHYRPYELNPAMPDKGVDRKKYLESKYGPGIRGAHERLAAWGKEVGITYDFEKDQKIINSFNAHRLVWLAGKSGLEKEMVEALFKAYFSDARDLSDKKTLAEIAVGVGLDGAKVESLLNSGEGTEEVRALEEKAYNLGITGVPHFVFNGEAELSGAHPVETFAAVLNQFKSQKS